MKRLLKRPLCVAVILILAAVVLLYTVPESFR